MFRRAVKQQSRDFIKELYVWRPVTCPVGAGLVLDCVTLKPGFVPTISIVTEKIIPQNIGKLRYLFVKIRKMGN